jgi:hypothetical protein
VTHLSTSKASHCAHVSPLPTIDAALSSLWWGPKLGTLLTSTAGLLLSLCPKSKVLVTRNCLLLLSKSLGCKPNLLLDEVIPHPLPCRHNLPSNNAPYKWTSRLVKLFIACLTKELGFTTSPTAANSSLIYVYLPRNEVTVSSLSM